MIELNSKIFLTFNEGGKYITKRGEYSVAKLSGGDITTPSKTLKQPEYADCTRALVLSTEFINNALEMPKGPKKNTGEWHRWLRSPLGNLALNWKKYSDLEKLEIHIKSLVEDLTGLSDLVKNEHYKFELI
ncbi:MAG: hypothetical protein M0R17_04365 [Candidatus Omnitrophica bacterium]|jgi:hypothetical protein|nr:hypothetical protein [Candidatus Omnitrophota bacterium]